jgi:hypothetical protein
MMHTTVFIYLFTKPYQIIHQSAKSNLLGDNNRYIYKPGERGGHDQGLVSRPPTYAHNPKSAFRSRWLSMCTVCERYKGRCHHLPWIHLQNRDLCTNLAMPFVDATMTSDSATTLRVSINTVTIETSRHHAVESRHPTQKMLALCYLLH